MRYHTTQHEFAKVQNRPRRLLPFAESDPWWSWLNTTTIGMSAACSTLALPCMCLLIHLLDPTDFKKPWPIRICFYTVSVSSCFIFSPKVWDEGSGLEVTWVKRKKTSSKKFCFHNVSICFTVFQEAKRLRGSFCSYPIIHHVCIWRIHSFSAFRSAYS